MLKSLLILVTLQLLVRDGLAEHVRRRGGERAKGETGKPRGLKALMGPNQNRQLKKGPHYGYFEEQHYGYSSDMEGDDYYGDYRHYRKKKKSKKKSKSGYVREPRKQRCRKVVEPAEFVIENAFEEIVPDPEATTDANATGDSDSDAGPVGTQYVFQGPLYDDDFDVLRDYFISGVCARTWNATDDLPGAAMCKMTLTLETGACLNFQGEVFDEWRNVLAITGGTFELAGISGQVVLVAVDDDLDEERGDFFSSDFIHGQATLIYNICPEGYWDPLIVEDPEDLEGGTFPDPFGLEDSSDMSSSS